MTRIEKKKSKMWTQPLWTPHRIFTKQRRRTASLNPTSQMWTPAPLNPGRPNNNPEALLFSDFFIFTRATGSGWNGGIGTTRESAGDGVPDLSNPRRCAWVFGRIWRGRLGFQPNTAETHAQPLSLAGEREALSFSASLRNTTYSGRFSLPLSFSVTGRCAWVTDLSSSLFLRRRPDFSSSLSPAGVWNVQTIFFWKVSNHIN
jgi:hypothetical protein